MYTCYVQSFKILASFCSCVGWFESYLVENPQRHVFAWCGSYNTWRCHSKSQDASELAGWSCSCLHILMGFPMIWLIRKIFLVIDLAASFWKYFEYFFLSRFGYLLLHIWTVSSELGTYSLCEQRRFRRACASAQSRQNLRCSLIQAVSQEEPSDRKPDSWPLWMAGHAQLKCHDAMLEDTNSLDGAHI